MTVPIVAVGVTALAIVVITLVVRQEVHRRRHTSEMGEFLKKVAAQSLNLALRNPDRLGAVYASGLLKGKRAADLQKMTDLAAAVLGVEVALVTVLTADEQVFVASTDPKGTFKGLTSVPVDESFCQYVVASNSPLAVTDAHLHPLVCDSIAIPEFGVVSYLGAPITDPHGNVIGSFCVLDSHPREWTDLQFATIRGFAKQAALIAFDGADA